MPKSRVSFVSLASRVVGRAGLLAGLAGVCVLAGPALGQELNAQIQRAISEIKLGKVKIGVSVVDLSTGQTLANIGADQAMIPASNMKLLTSGAALITLGPEFRFRTELVRDGSRLILKGGGDPALADPEVLKESQPPMTVDDVLGAFVSATKKSGPGAITEIIVDDRVFDRELVHPSWNPANLHRGYSAQVSGLNFHANVLSIFLTPNPQGPGTPPIMRLEPDAPWLGVVNQARTSGESTNTAGASRPPESNAITVRGEVGRGANTRVEVSLHDNAMMAGRYLAGALRAGGVEVALSPTAETPNVRLVGLEETLPQGQTILAIVTPIGTVARRCNSFSDNLYAEAMFKRMGNAVTKSPGSWTNGASALRMILVEKLGPGVAAQTFIADGSGLSRDNQVSPATFTRWLGAMASSSAGEVYIASLAEPGKPGTLEKRFRGVKLSNDLHAKSGLLNGVRSLSGYLIDPATKKRVAFSVIANELQQGEAMHNALEVHEAVVKAADQWLARNAGESAKVGG